MVMIESQCSLSQCDILVVTSSYSCDEQLSVNKYFNLI